ncbi:MAG: hypothetical protein ACUVTZ_02535 [Armatimonadota bacterium]
MRSRRRTRILKALVWPVLILLASFAAAIWMVLAVPPEPEMMEPPAKLEAQSAKVRELLDVSARAASGSVDQRRRAVLTDADLNAFLASDPGALRRLSEKQVKKVRVTLGDGQVCVSSLVHVRGRDMSVAAEGTVSAEDGGRVVFRPNRVRVGRLWMPAALAIRLSGQDRLLSKEIVYEAPANITHLRVHDRKLEVEWTPAGG